MPNSKLKTSFQTWCADSARSNLNPKDYPTTLDGAKRMMDDLLWRAYEEGYRQCQEDIKAAIDRMG